MRKERILRRDRAEPNDRVIIQGMSTTSLISADELLRRSSDLERCELIAGELRMMSPSGWPHGKVVGNLHGLLWRHIREHDLGLLFGAETGFLIARNPDTVRAPDIAFISKQQALAQESEEGYWPGAPELAVEVLSPGDRTGEVDEKIEAWLEAGTAAVWVVNPKLRTVTLYQSTHSVQVKKSGQILDGNPVVPGFSCPVDELFR